MIEDVRKSDLLAKLNDVLPGVVSQDLWLLSIGTDKNPLGQYQSLIPAGSSHKNLNGCPGTKTVGSQAAMTELLVAGMAQWVRFVWNRWQQKCACPITFQSGEFFFKEVAVVIFVQGNTMLQLLKVCEIILHNIALVIHKCDYDDQCAWRRMFVNIIYSHNCSSLLIILSTKVHYYYFASLYSQ